MQTLLFSELFSRNHSVLNLPVLYFIVAILGLPSSESQLLSPNHLVVVIFWCILQKCTEKQSLVRFTHLNCLKFLSSRIPRFYQLCEHLAWIHLLRYTLDLICYRVYAYESHGFDYYQSYHLVYFRLCTQNQIQTVAFNFHLLQMLLGTRLLLFTHELFILQQCRVNYWKESNCLDMLPLSLLH